MSILGILPAVAGVANSFVNAHLQAQQNKQNQINFEKTLEYQRQFYKDNNEYNSPSSVVNRLTAAGLNPNLVYGHGQATTPASMPTVPTPPQHQAPHSSFDPSIFIPLKQLEIQKDVADADIALKKANEEKLRAEIPNVEANTKLIEAQTALANQTYDISFQEAKSRIESMDLDNEQKRKLMPLVEAQYMLQNEYVSEQITDEKYLREYKVALMKAQENSANASALSSYASANWTRAQTDFFNKTVHFQVATMMENMRHAKYSAESARITSEREAFDAKRYFGRTIEHFFEDSWWGQFSNSFLKPLVELAAPAFSPAASLMRPAPVINRNYYR